VAGRRYDTAQHDIFDYQKPYRWPGIDYWCPHDAPLSDDALNDAGTDMVDRRCAPPPCGVPLAGH
jgi:hypothetical protein